MQLSTLFKKFSIDKRFLCNVKFSVKNFCDTSTTTYCVFLFFIYLYIVVFAVGRSLTCKRSQIRVLSSPPKTAVNVLCTLAAVFLIRKELLVNLLNMLYNGVNADMAELADAQDLESCGQPCEFDPHYPHQKYCKTEA